MGGQLFADWWNTLWPFPTLFTCHVYVQLQTGLLVYVSLPDLKEYLVETQNTDYLDFNLPRVINSWMQRFLGMLEERILKSLN